jgi:hypothetical protein
MQIIVFLENIGVNIQNLNFPLTLAITPLKTKSLSWQVTRYSFNPGSCLKLTL